MTLRRRVFIEHAEDLALRLLVNGVTIVAMLVIFGSILYAVLTR